MKTCKEIVETLKLVIWDGTSDIKCPTGVFPATEIKNLWGIGRGANLFYITASNGTVAKMYGTDLGSPHESEDIVECGKMQVKDLVTDLYRQQEGVEATAECDMQTVEDYLVVVDMRTA